MQLNEQVDFSFITKKKWTQKQFFRIFCGIMIFGIILFLVSLLILGVERWRFLFFLLIDPEDSFMDFFNPLAWSTPLSIAYQRVFSIYPPITVLWAGLLGSLFPTEISSVLRAFPLRASCLGTGLLISFLTLTCFGFFSLLGKLKTGSYKAKLLFCALIFFSSPFLHWIERGNYIIIAIIGSLFFVMYYDNPKAWLRQFALIMLALAINTKIYPVVLGLLLFKDKQYKDILYLCLYSLLFLFVPLFWLGGINGFLLFLRNLPTNSGTAYSLGYGYSLSLFLTLKMIVYAFTNQEFAVLNTVFSFISFAMLPIGAVAAYFIKSKWKTLALLCLLMILIPSISYTYILIFLAIPLAYFLNEEQEHTFRDLIYLILFCLIFMLNIPALVSIFTPGGYPVLFDNFCAKLSCLVMFIMLVRDSYIVIKEKFSPCKNCPYFCDNGIQRIALFRRVHEIGCRSKFAF